jgi:hypothetical protein
VLEGPGEVTNLRGPGMAKGRGTGMPGKGRGQSRAWGSGSKMEGETRPPYLALQVHSDGRWPQQGYWLCTHSGHCHLPEPGPGTGSRMGGGHACRSEGCW